MQQSQKEVEESCHKDVRNWKLGGFIYFSKVDKRTFVEKSNPTVGITLNFGNPKSYLVLLFSFLFFGFIFYMISKNE